MINYLARSLSQGEEEEREEAEGLRAIPRTAFSALFPEEGGVPAPPGAAGSSALSPVPAGRGRSAPAPAARWGRAEEASGAVPAPRSTGEEAPVPALRTVGTLSVPLEGPPARREGESLSAGGAGPAALSAAPLLASLRRAEEAAQFLRTQRRSFTLTLPEPALPREASLTPEGLDRAVERDARRWGGDFPLY